MKKSTLHIVFAWLLLFCFVAGQYVVYAHRHANTSVAAKSVNHSKQTVSENCRICDAMHHTVMALNNTPDFTPVTVSEYHYQDCVYNFTSIALILSAGRSPPVA